MTEKKKKLLKAKIAAALYESGKKAIIEKMLEEDNTEAEIKF